MRMLIVEDDPDILNALQNGFEQASFAVDGSEIGEEGSYLARTNSYDIILLDNVLPKKDGFQICQEIRASGKEIPIIMLSVKTGVALKTGILNMGADDYITKPFFFEEVLARVRAILRRPPTIKPTILKILDLTLDPSTQRVIRNKREIYLTRKEFSLLEYMMGNVGKVLSREMILEHVWNRESDPFSNTIEAHILNLRKKVDTGKKKMIKTLPGRGYKLEI